MSKVVKFAFDYMSLSDVVQALPWPGGYSPTLPTGPNVTPVNTSGISVTDKYQTNVVAAAGLTYGVTNLSIAAATASQMTLNVPAYTNMLIYNGSGVRLVMAPVGYVGTNIPVIACRPGMISQWSWTLLNGAPPANTTQAGTINSFIFYAPTTNTAPTVAPANTANLAANSGVQIFWWQDNPPQD